MRLRHLGWLCLPLVLVGCGGSKHDTTLTVTCAGGVALSGAHSIDVAGDTVNGRPTLIFPDPVNGGRPNTMAVAPGDRCTIAPTPDQGS